MKVLEGLGVSRGVAIGRAVTVSDPGDHVLRFHLAHSQRRNRDHVTAGEAGDRLQRNGTGVAVRANVEGAGEIG